MGFNHLADGETEPGQGERFAQELGTGSSLPLSQGPDWGEGTVEKQPLTSLWPVSPSRL
jgi:hypothetical protein